MNNVKPIREILYFDWGAMKADPSHPHWAQFNACRPEPRQKPTLTRRLSAWLTAQLNR